MNFKTGVTFILAAAGLSACVSSTPQYSRPTAPPPQANLSPVDGNWADGNWEDVLAADPPRLPRTPGSAAPTARDRSAPASRQPERPARG